jgi:hypothetical protein
MKFKRKVRNVNAEKTEKELMEGPQLSVFVPLVRLRVSAEEKR